MFLIKTERFVVLMTRTFESMNVFFGGGLMLKGLVFFSVVSDKM